ncbi:MAG: thioredoxin [Candidatus Komeilibacteria bacterium]|nr:thioredoxin [Candidatus Komeilibacteria bacterium]
MDLTDKNFESEVLKSDQPVLVDFFAEWCGPCKMQAPIIEELEQEFAGKAKVLSLDVDANQQTASEFQVMSIPTLIFFKNGKAVERVMGLQRKDALVDKLNSLL